MINDLTTWYYSIRFVLSFAAAAGVFGLLIRKKRYAAVTVVFPFVILAVSYIVLTLFPAEKWLLRFDTPQEAFRYYSRMNILRIDERENCALIVAETHTNDTEKTQEGGGYTFYILTKQNGGWRINPFTPKRYYALSSDKTKSVFLQKMHVPDTEDCFIVCPSRYHNGVPVEHISDNRNSTFQFFDVPVTNAKDFYYALVNDVDENYECYVDGETIRFDRS